MLCTIPLARLRARLNWLFKDTKALKALNPALSTATVRTKKGRHEKNNALQARVDINLEVDHFSCVGECVSLRADSKGWQVWRCLYNCTRITRTCFTTTLWASEVWKRIPPFLCTQMSFYNQKYHQAFTEYYNKWFYATVNRLYRKWRNISIFDLCYKPGTAKRQVREAKEFWRFEEFSQTLITPPPPVCPVVLANTDAVQSQL